MNPHMASCPIDIQPQVRVALLMQAQAGVVITSCKGPQQVQQIAHKLRILRTFGRGRNADPLHRPLGHMISCSACGLGNLDITCGGFFGLLRDGHSAGLVFCTPQSRLPSQVLVPANLLGDLFGLLLANADLLTEKNTEEVASSSQNYI